MMTASQPVVSSSEGGVVPGVRVVPVVPVVPVDRGHLGVGFE